MNNKKIIFGIVLFLAICFLAFTFANPADTGSGVLVESGNDPAGSSSDDGTSVTSISLSSSIKTSIEEGEEVSLNPTVLPSTAVDKSLTYSSSDTSVIKVDQNGVVTGVGKGSATVTITSGNGKTKVITFTVGEEDDDTTIADNNSGNGSSGNSNLPVSTGNSGNTGSGNGSNTNSGNTSGAGNNGNNSNGSNNTTGGSTNSGNNSSTGSGTTTVAVKSVSISLNNSGTTLVVGQTANVTATPSPSNATDKSITYSSNNSNIATVDQNGVITAKGIGTVTITATAKNGVNNSITLNVVGNSRGNVAISIVSGKANLNTGTFTDSSHMTLSGELDTDNVEIRARIYAPKLYTLDMLKDFSFRNSASPYNIVGSTGISSTGNDLYFDIVIDVPKAMAESSLPDAAKMLHIYINWLGTSKDSSEVEYVFDFSQLKAGN